MAVGGAAMGRAEEAEEEAIVGRLAAVAAAADGPDTLGGSVGGRKAGSSGVSNGSKKDISLTAANLPQEYFSMGLLLLSQGDTESQ